MPAAVHVDGVQEVERRAREPVEPANDHDITAIDLIQIDASASAGPTAASPWPLLAHFGEVDDFTDTIICRLQLCP
jgi:hypothetical protein